MHLRKGGFNLFRDRARHSVDDPGPQRRRPSTASLRVVGARLEGLAKRPKFVEVEDGPSDKTEVVNEHVYLVVSRTRGSEDGLQRLVDRERVQWVRVW